jgi:hypothetical protein
MGHSGGGQEIGISPSQSVQLEVKAVANGEDRFVHRVGILASNKM